MFHRPSDPVEKQFRELERQGSGLAHIANFLAFLLVILFSAGSLVALGGDALQSVVTAWQHGRVDVPSVISLSVSTLLVACFDIGMVYAASQIRLLKSRRANSGDTVIHWLIIIIVGALEASTYAYMSAVYEHPINAVAWALILARAATAPLLSVYLSLARPLPITARDILYQTELASGKGVVRDVIREANQVDAPLDDKMRLYKSSAVMAVDDEERLTAMIRAVLLNERHRVARQNGLPLTLEIEAVNEPNDAPYGDESERQLYLQPVQDLSGGSAASWSGSLSSKKEQPHSAPSGRAKKEQKGRSKNNGRMPRRLIKLSPRERIRRAIQLDPDATNTAIAAQLGVGRNTVKDEREKMLREAADSLSTERIENAE